MEHQRRVARLGDLLGSAAKLALNSSRTTTPVTENKDKTRRWSMPEDILGKNKEAIPAAGIEALRKLQGSTPGTPGSASKWGKIRQSVNATAQMKRAVRKKLEEHPPSALQRRKEYDAEVLANMQSKTHLRLERTTMALKDIINLKAYFDELDIDGDGVVTMAEMAIHRKNRSLQSSGEDVDPISKVLSNQKKDFTFEAMLKFTHPDITDKDVEVCIQALHGKFPYMAPKKDKITVTPHLKAISDMWVMYADKDGVTFENFLEANQKLGEGITYNDCIDLYDEYANEKIDRIEYKEFTLWWVNMNREVPLRWEDIRAEVEAFNKVEEPEEEEEEDKGVAVVV